MNLRQVNKWNAIHKSGRGNLYEKRKQSIHSGAHHDHIYSKCRVTSKDGRFGTITGPITRHTRVARPFAAIYSWRDAIAGHRLINLVACARGHYRRSRESEHLLMNPLSTSRHCLMVELYFTSRRETRPTGKSRAKTAPLDCRTNRREKRGAWEGGGRVMTRPAGMYVSPMVAWLLFIAAASWKQNV